MQSVSELLDEDGYLDPSLKDEALEKLSETAEELTSEYCSLLLGHGSHEEVTGDHSRGTRRRSSSCAG